MATYNGTAGNDVQFLGATADKMFGLAGDDTLGGGAGKDTIDGGEGDDVVIGGGNDGSADVLRGGVGDDFLVSWFGDKLEGGDGIDIGQFGMAAVVDAIVVTVSATEGSGEVNGSIAGISMAKATFSSSKPCSSSPGPVPTPSPSAR